MLIGRRGEEVFFSLLGFHIMLGILYVKRCELQRIMRIWPEVFGLRCTPRTSDEAR